MAMSSNRELPPEVVGMNPHQILSFQFVGPRLLEDSVHAHLAGLGGKHAEYEGVPAQMTMKFPETGSKETLDTDLDGRAEQWLDGFKREPKGNGTAQYWEALF